MKLRYLILLIMFLMSLSLGAQNFTQNLQLQLPSRGQPDWDTIINSNFTTIDNAVGALQNVFQGNWSSTQIYGKGQQVTYLNAMYISILNNNSGNIPSTSPLSWQFMINTGAGTVTSIAVTTPGVLYTVAGSPITTTGAFTFNLVNQTPNSVFAGPATGTTAIAPNFRSLVAADLPLTLNSNTTGNASTASSLAATPTPCAAGSYARGVDVFGNSVNCTVATGGGGSVSSVGMTVPGVLFSVAGSPVTSSGTLALSLLAQTANTILAGPTTGTAAAPTMRALVVADLPTVDVAHGGTGGITTTTARSGIGAAASGANSDITALSGLTTALSVAQGGTGATSASAARTSLSAAASGVNTDITSTTGVAKGNVASWSGGTSGSITTTPANTQFTNIHTTTPAAINVVSFTLSFGVGTASCTTQPSYQLYDVTTSTVLSTITTTNATLYFANTGLSIAIASGHDITFRVGTAGVACTAPSSATFTIWYTM